MISAERFTVADISVGYACLFSDANGLGARLPEAVRGYWERLKQREGFKRADMAQKEAAEAAGIRRTF